MGRPSCNSVKDRFTVMPGIDPTEKYTPFQPIDLPDRRWPSAVITRPPIWCSVDLRDGNQALVEPMGRERKLRMFAELLQLGFKEIEVGFPSASQTDFDFCRHIIEEGLIPDDVTIQVLTQSREELIRRSFEAIAGARRAIVHLYNSTSTLQRRVVFGLDRDGITRIAVEGAQLIRELTPTVPETEVVYQYSPESFTGTELDYAKEICDAVADVWEPTPERKMIVNLPATVEMATPNIYADQIEWMHRHLARRDSIVLSLHPHNDRGTGVAAAELAFMAGAERIEGTLFGNGERTGNVDIVTLAVNMYTQGVDPGLDFSDINRTIGVAEHCNRLPIHPRHPWAGELVYTAFSGSHQDAIKKGFAALEKANSPVWEVPYLPIDPADLGRSYETVVRINSQSGKGGVAYILERNYGVSLPRPVQVEFSQQVQQIADDTEEELAPGRIWEAFERNYLKATSPLEFVADATRPDPHASEMRLIEATVRENGVEKRLSGRGNGPIDAYMDALRRTYALDLALTDFHEHAVGKGAGATAAAFVQMTCPDGRIVHGAGMDPDIVAASLKAVTSAVNRAGAIRAG